MLTRGLELLDMLKEDLAYLGAEDLHQLQRSWELQHPVLGPRMCDASHHVSKRNALAGILLSGRSSKTRRHGLALLHIIPIRSRIWEVDDGHGACVSHRRLNRIQRSLFFTKSCPWKESSV
ncbi:MAG: hypothetical protein CM1200mP41_07930 [Gammaproteobacteria bacterium]|nr:MAG: hypothetical protein CM1200mP41_07930 [Gammaproteobacteria bacterium]